MNPNKALWEKGDFTRIAATMRASGAAFVDGLAVARDLDVLDLGCGDGTTAIPAAKRGANVLGVLVAAGIDLRRRVQQLIDQLGADVVVGVHHPAGQQPLAQGHAKTSSQASSCRSDQTWFALAGLSR